MEELVRLNGFTDVKEFNKLIANVDLSSLLKRETFKHWQHEDGTKEGLLKLPTVQR
jgi:hypothetical protein